MESLQKSNACSQDHAAVLVAVADDFPARVLGSFPGDNGP